VERLHLVNFQVRLLILENQRVQKS